MNKTVIGWKLYYGDGSVVSSHQATWRQAPSDNVQVLSIYYQETYKIWRDGQSEDENYRDMYFGKDYYWQFGNGQAGDVPAGVSIKLGRELDQSDWRNLYNIALQDTKYVD